MFFNKNYLSVRVYCPMSGGKIETVFVYGIPHGSTFEPLINNGCDNMSGSALCQNCRKDLVRLLQKDPSLLDEQPISPIRENS